MYVGEHDVRVTDELAVRVLDNVAIRVIIGGLDDGAQVIDGFVDRVVDDEYRLTGIQIVYEE